MKTIHGKLAASCQAFRRSAFLAPGTRHLLNMMRILAVLAIASSANAEPLFKNSVVSNDIDFIHADDPAPACQIVDAGIGQRELPGREGKGLMAAGVFLFKLQYADGTQVEAWADPDFQTRETAGEAVLPVSRALGKLPISMRRKLSHVVINGGDGTAFAEDKAHFFVLYADNIQKRVSEHDLEETIFHETVHATLEAEHATSAAWVEAQGKDAAFITEYAANLPAKEDLPESALFAYTLLKHPGRMPASVEESVRRIMPNRLAYFEKLFEDMETPSTTTGAPDTEVKKVRPDSTAKTKSIP